MRELVHLRVRVPADCPVAVPDAVKPMAKALRDGLVAFELPSTDPRWRAILEFCARRAAWWRTTRTLEEAGVVRRPWHRGVDELAERLTRAPVDPGVTAHPEHDYVVRVRRTYRKLELVAAALLRWIPGVTLECSRRPETMGEIYDLGRQCPLCGTVPQIADLLFDSCRGPLATDIARVMGTDEHLVSERLVRLLSDQGVTGCTTRKIWQRRDSARHEIAGWRQLVVTAETGPLAEPTVFGRDILHPDPAGGKRCVGCGLTREHGIQSELYVPRESWDGSDVAVTRDSIGGGMAVGLPASLLVIAPRFYRLLLEHKIKGYTVEVAHLV